MRDFDFFLLGGPGSSCLFFCRETGGIKGKGKEFRKEVGDGGSDGECVREL